MSLELSGIAFFRESRLVERNRSFFGLIGMLGFGNFRQFPFDPFPPLNQPEPELAPDWQKSWI